MQKSSHKGKDGHDAFPGNDFDAEFETYNQEEDSQLKKKIYSKLKAHTKLNSDRIRLHAKIV